MLQRLLAREQWLVAWAFLGKVGVDVMHDWKSPGASEPARANSSGLRNILQTCRIDTATERSLALALKDAIQNHVAVSAIRFRWTEELFELALTSVLSNVVCLISAETNPWADSGPVSEGIGDLLREVQQEIVLYALDKTVDDVFDIVPHKRLLKQLTKFTSALVNFAQDRGRNFSVALQFWREFIGCYHTSRRGRYRPSACAFSCYSTSTG